MVVSCIGAASRNDTIMSVTAGHLLDILNEKSSLAIGSAPRLVMMTSLGCGGTSPSTKAAMKMMFGCVFMDDMDLADRMIRDGSAAAH